MLHESLNHVAVGLSEANSLSVRSNCAGRVHAYLVEHTHLKSLVQGPITGASMLPLL